MPCPPQYDHLKPQIEELLQRGLPRYRTAETLGINVKTLARILNPEVRKRHNEKVKAKYIKRVRQQDNTEQKFKKYCKRRIQHSKAISKRHGYLPCNATVKELTDSYTGQCHICGVPEKKLDRKLCVDHCHFTGQFRGWLCHRCNTGLGMIQDYLNQAITYLEKTKG